MQPFSFSTILESAREMYAADDLPYRCPETQNLLDLAYGELDAQTAQETNLHLKQCDICGIAMLKIITDLHQWELEMAASPEKAVSRALGRSGKKVVRQLISPQTSGKILSTTKDALFAWCSQLWIPQWAGQTITAADLSEQHRYFDMDDGEYLDLRCFWEGAQNKQTPQIRLTWSANIFTPSTIWIHFINPDTNELMGKICLGTNLEGMITVTKPELKFDPSLRRWGIRIEVEPE